MEIIVYECLKGYHRRFTETDSKPELYKLNAFTNMMQGDYSGKNLISKIISSDEHWENLLNTKGFGRGLKYDKAQAYREELTAVWNTIKETFNTKNEVEISKLMGLYLWDMEEDNFTNSYLGVIEEALKQNKLWKSPVVSDIFCSFFGFLEGTNKSLDEIAGDQGIVKERVRQIKEESLQSFESDFWFLKDNLIKEKLEKLFDLASHELEQINEQSEQVNRDEGVHFAWEFYTKILSIAFDMVLIGNVNDIIILNKRSSTGNVWRKLYLQTQLEYERCDLEGLIDALAVEMYNHHYYFKEDTNVDISAYISVALDDYELSRYSSIVGDELENEVVLLPEKAIIKRNNLFKQPEMVEAALRELGGFAYADDILQKVIQIHPEKDWTMQVLRTSFRGDKFYSVGKSGLFGLKDMRDLRGQMGNGTLNEIMRIYMSKKDSPIHIHELRMHINEIFPRPKTLNSVHTILEQNNKKYFKKFVGGFYGLEEKRYEKTGFPKIVGGHGRHLRQIIDESNGIGFEEVFKIFNEKYGIMDIQIRYLLNQMMETKRISFINGFYQRYVEPTIPNDALTDVPTDEIDVEVNQEELDFEELNQQDVPDELLRDAVAQIKVRRGQPRFRQKLLTFYRKTCIITGCQIPELLEAAHILPYSEKEDFSLSNGILLRADIHTLFDLGLIAIDPKSMRLKLNEAIEESSEYADLNNIDIGKKLTALNHAYKINEEGLYWRWESFIEL